MLKWFKRKKQEKKKSSGKSYYSNEEWVEHLSGTVDNAALQELRSILVRGLKPALSKYVDRELDQFVEDVTQDALLKILDNVDTFRGESKFVTWAMKIAVREGLTELRRKRWDDISIEDLKNPGNQEGEEGGEVFSDTFAADEPSPEHVTSQKLMLEKVHSIIDNILTDKQRRAITLLMIHGLPITVVAEQMDTNRNSLYKLVHDARKKIKNEFEVQGLDPEKILDEISHL
ncbi:MAG: sigma-70 family RNA polymerase sigma factor [Balneolaceae bacterium]|nr:sigma-70 family RNA polymerase sigma factor [Balneolaceae bacterium]